MIDFTDSNQASFGQAEDFSENSFETIKRFYAQIQEMPELMARAEAVDQILLRRFQDLRTSALTIITQLNAQKPTILGRFDLLLAPIAKDVLDRLLHDAEQLSYTLNDKIEQMQHNDPLDWKEYAKCWVQIYVTWNDRKALVDKVLELVSSRTSQLIDKDIQVIHDYQTQSLAHLSKESEAFRNLEMRLARATEGPLKQLFALREQPQQHNSLKQASEWVANLQEQRESYFDQLLMKIDLIVKDVVQIDHEDDLTSFSEQEAEIVFMERELHNVQTILPKIDKQQEEDVQFIAARLDSLLDHANELNQSDLPQMLRQRILTINNDCQVALNHLRH